MCGAFCISSRNSSDFDLSILKPFSLSRIIRIFWGDFSLNISEYSVCLSKFISTNL